MDTEQTPELWPPAGTTRAEDGGLVTPDGETVPEAEDPGDAEPPMDTDPTPVFNEDADEDLSGLPDGEDDGDTDLEDEDEPEGPVNA